VSARRERQAHRFLQVAGERRRALAAGLPAHDDEFVAALVREQVARRQPGRQGSFVLTK
jgi:hypothetical protein